MTASRFRANRAASCSTTVAVAGREPRLRAELWTDMRLSPWTSGPVDREQERRRGFPRSSRVYWRRSRRFVAFGNSVERNHEMLGGPHRLRRERRAPAVCERRDVSVVCPEATRASRYRAENPRGTRGFSRAARRKRRAGGRVGALRKKRHHNDGAVVLRGDVAHLGFELRARRSENAPAHGKLVVRPAPATRRASSDPSPARASGRAGIRPDARVLMRKRGAAADRSTNALRIGRQIQGGRSTTEGSLKNLAEKCAN